jgi:class 3 adenylate cyclase
MPEERKLVTILFTDVAGSTALGEGLDPEDLRALMGRYYTHARRIVPEHGGTLEKFIGDAVMAVFGLPHAHSNDAERALAAALALRDAIESDMALAEKPTLRLGVNTGPVVAAASEEVTRGDFLVTGDAVNVAARLEQAAEPGEILVSGRTAAATEASFTFGPPRQISVKGKSQPLGVYPLTAQRPARQLGRPPLVGRKRDLTLLSLLAERAGRAAAATDFDCRARRDGQNAPARRIPRPGAGQARLACRDGALPALRPVADLLAAARAARRPPRRALQPGGGESGLCRWGVHT